MKNLYNNQNAQPKTINKSFTIIELLMVIVVLGILASLLMPYLSEAKINAKYIRWLTYNNNLNNDPTCVVNFNFQGDGPAFSAPPPGDVLINKAVGSEGDGYSPKYYNGYLKNKNGGPHNFEWVKAGRYGKYKWALKFNGVDTYVLIPTSKALDFTPDSDFTVMCWIKFDKLDLGDCPFSKSLWGTRWDAAAQYDIYAMPWAGEFGQGSFDVDVFTTCGTWPNTEIEFDKAGWVHLALRYKNTGVDSTGKVTGNVQVFINGQALGDFIDTTEDNPYTATATGYQPCIDNRIPMILGGAGCYRKYWSRGTWDPEGDGLDNTWVIKFFFQGLIDEFVVFNRALPNGEITGHYDMGKM